MALSVTNPTLLEGLFCFYPKSSPEYNVIITTKQLSYSVKLPAQHENSKKKPETNVIKFADIIGCDCMRGKPPNDTVAYLNIYSYPHHKKIIGKSTLRKRKVITITFKSKSTFEDNLKEASHWQLVMSYSIRRVGIKNTHGALLSLNMLFM